MKRVVTSMPMPRPRPILMGRVGKNDCPIFVDSGACIIGGT